MAGALTGDYDAVAAFSLGAIDRILAAMHRGKRFPHSMSIAIDDYPDFKLGVVAVSMVDTYGRALTDATRVKKAAYERITGVGGLSEEVLRNVDPVVNWRPQPTPVPVPVRDLPLAGNVIDHLQVDEPFIGIAHLEDYSYLSGVAQLQMGPPTMRIVRGHTDRAEIHTPAMIYYHPDAQTIPLPQFLRGDIVTAFGIKPVTAGGVTNVVVDLVSPSSSVHFDPKWSVNSLTNDDKAAINKALSRAVRNTFRSSTTAVPSSMKKLHFKGFEAEGAVAALMNVVTEGGASPNSVTGVALRPDDHFSLSVSAESITEPFAQAVNSAINPRHQSFDTTVHTDYLIGTNTFHIYTNIYVLDARVDLVNLPLFPKGQILLTIPVQVRFGWKNLPDILPDPVNFDFSIVQAFTLTLNGRHVGLAKLGDLAVLFPPGVPGNEESEARKQATTTFNNAWNSQQANVQAQIDKALNAEALQSLIRSLMNPASPGGSGSTKPEQVDPVLFYTDFEIRPAGITLHGQVNVPSWPTPQVDFEKDPWSPPAGPEYSALNSWIPGGTISEFQWHYGATTAKDINRFVTKNAPALEANSNKICLTFDGKRITAAGPIFYESVSSTTRKCSWTSIPLGMLGPDLKVGNRPHVVVPKPRPDPRQVLEVAAHTSPWRLDAPMGGTANFLVHFPDEGSARHLEELSRALERSGRSDTATAILCVLTAEQLASTHAPQGLLYADDAHGWERLLGVRERPATVLLSPKGKITWRHDGEIGAAALAEALRGHLAKGGEFSPQFVDPPLRIGLPSPNFLYPIEPGHSLTLRTLLGKPLALLFWRSSSEASLVELRNLQAAYRQPEAEARLIVAINDGEDGEFARGLAAGEHDGVMIVPDPARQISQAYGITMWPTTVFLDSGGVVQDVRLGLIDEQEMQPTVRSKDARPASAASSDKHERSE